MTKSGNVVKLIESNGNSQRFEHDTTNPRLSPSAQLMWEHFGKCLKHCQRIESSLTALGLESEDACFPVIVGRRPPEYTRVLQSSAVGNKENLSPTAPSAVNVRTVQLFVDSWQISKLYRPTNSFVFVMRRLVVTRPP